MHDIDKFMPHADSFELKQAAFDLATRLVTLRNSVGRIDLTDSANRDTVYDLVLEAEKLFGR